MANILFIAPSSYPLNGPEAYVNAKVVKILSEAGHIIDIVSLKSERRDRHYPPESNNFYFQKANSINVVKVNTGKNISTVLNHIGCFLKTGFVYKGSDWAFKAIKKCEELVRKNDYEFIYTYDYPSEIVGLYLTKKYKIKWVATWNDPYIMQKYPKPYGNGINANIPANRLKLIKEIGKWTYKNIFPNERLRDYMLRYMDTMNPDSCIISPHIVLEDYVTNNKHKSKILRMVHSGSIGKERDPRNFFIALHNILKKNPDYKIEVTFLGINDRGKPEYIENLIRELDLENVIKFHPPIPYSQSLEFIRDYDICLIIEAQCEEGIFLPSKVADYLQALKSIFSLSPNTGVLNDLWNNKLIPYFGDIASVQSIENEIEVIISDYNNQSLKFESKAISYFGNKRVCQIHTDLLSK
ncbi:MAG: hypothetical protein K2L45_06670 [Muribaculaceae bacterium]|nr:hypothetical protein [Muribaculaceae bacterium]